MMLRRVVLALALVCAAVLPSAYADPREVENADTKDEFGEDFEERMAPSAAADQRLEFVLEHNIPAKTEVEVQAPKPASDEDEEEEDEVPQFTGRGRVEIVLSASAAKPRVSFLDVPALSTSEVDYLARMLHENKLYTIRTHADPKNPASPYVMTSIPLCMLASTRLREDLTFHLSNDGKLLGMEYLTPFGGPAVCKEAQKHPMENMKLTSTGTALQPQNGPAPPKVIAVKKKEAPPVVKNPIKQEDEDEQTPPEKQSFLRRYWYIILPIAIFTLFGGGGDPQPQGGATGGAPAAGPRRR